MVQTLFCASMYYLSFNPQNNSRGKFLLSLFVYEETDEPKKTGEYFSHTVRSRARF